MLFAITLGSIFEIFDFLSFAFLAPIISRVFFPVYLHNVAILFTYLTISISYLLRPVGGVIIAHLGDKYGRKSAFTLSILLMAIPSLIIGILPTFQTLGYIATAIMIGARILQGFSLGGEVPGAITYLAENFSQRNYFFYCSWLTFGANLGVALGAGIISLLTHYTSVNFMYHIGWRVPFLFGALLTFIGFYIRKSASESSQFNALQMTKQLSKIPLITLLKQFKLPIISGVLLCIVVSIITAVFHIFLPTLLVSYYQLPLNLATNISIIGALTLAICSLFFAYLSGYIGVVRLLTIGGLSLSILFILMLLNEFKLQQQLLQHHVISLYYWVVAISIALACINGVFFGVLANLFPTAVRFSGIALCYNLAYIFGAGLTPLWTSIIMHTTGSYATIVAICLCTTLVALANIQFLLKHCAKTLVCVA